MTARMSRVYVTPYKWRTPTGDTPAVKIWAKKRSLIISLDEVRGLADQLHDHADDYEMRARYDQQHDARPTP